MGVRADTKEKEAVLVAWAFLEDGSRELVGVSLGISGGSHEEGHERADAHGYRRLPWPYQSGG